MAYETFDGGSRGGGPSLQPRVSVWTSGRIAFNEAAVDEWLDGADHVELMVHDSFPRFAVDPVDEETDVSYILQTKGNYAGKILHGKALLKELRCTRPDSSMVVKSRYDSGEGLVFVDLEPLSTG